MTLAQSMLAEFEQEAQTTRKFLDRLPDDKLTWKPHEKSMTAGQLALHIAGTPGQVMRMALADELVVPDSRRPNAQPESKQEVLSALEAGIATVREHLPTLTDGQMQETWQVKSNGAVLTSMPRAAVVRSILLNHWYHHRGQFGVYLRLVGAKVPSSYGPSGDELPDFMLR